MSTNPSIEEKVRELRGLRAAIADHGGDWQARFIYRIFHAVRSHQASLGILMSVPDDDWAVSDFIACAANNALAIIEELQSERDALKAQLPEGMKHCTILLKECDQGHGWLTATNWVEHGCPTCERDALKAELEREKIELMEQVAQGVLRIAELEADSNEGEQQ